MRRLYGGIETRAWVVARTHGLLTRTASTIAVHILRVCLTSQPIQRV